MFIHFEPHIIYHTYNEINNHFAQVFVRMYCLLTYLIINHMETNFFQYMYDDVQLTFRWISLTHTSLDYNKREIHVCIEIILFHS